MDTPVDTTPAPFEELRREVDELLAAGRVDEARAALETLQTAARAKALTGRR